MNSLKEMFNCLDVNQLKYNHNSLSNDSLLDNKFLKDLSKYDFKNEMSIWNILYFVKNNLENKTFIEQEKLIKENNLFMLDEINKVKNKEYDKSDIIESIKNNSNQSFTSKIFLSNYYQITLYIFYFDINICLKFGDFNKKHLIVITKDKCLLYYNDDKYNINLNNNDNIINYDEFKNFKKYKIDDLKNFCKKLNINLFKNDKKKIKKDLIIDIEDKLKYIK